MDLQLLGRPHPCQDPTVEALSSYENPEKPSLVFLMAKIFRWLKCPAEVYKITEVGLPINCNC